MRIFIIHSGSNYKEVIDIVNVIKNNFNRIDLLIIKKGLPFIWKFAAIKNIKIADLILVVVGERSYQSKYISWEIKTAISKNKEILIYKLNYKYRLPDSLYVKSEIIAETINNFTVYDKDSFSKLIAYINKSDSK